LIVLNKEKYNVKFVKYDQSVNIFIVLCMERFKMIFFLSIKKSAVVEHDDSSVSYAAAVVHQCDSSTRSVKKQKANDDDNDN
jgi:hypothetical protein